MYPVIIEVQNIGPPGEIGPGDMILKTELPFAPVAGMYIGQDWFVLVTKVSYSWSSVRPGTFFVTAVWPPETEERYNPYECLLAEGYEYDFTG